MKVAHAFSFHSKSTKANSRNDLQINDLSSRWIRVMMEILSSLCKRERSVSGVLGRTVLRRSRGAQTNTFIGIGRPLGRARAWERVHDWTAREVQRQKMQVCRRDATQDEANHSQGLLVITSVEFYYATGRWFSISTVDVGVAELKRFVTDMIR